MVEIEENLREESFEVGSKAVYPGYGVGSITAIEIKEICGSRQTFYTIEVADTGMKIMVPKSNAKTLGLRPIINEEEADQVLEILKEEKISEEEQTWNRRYREYMNKIKTGSVYAIAEVLRDLHLLKVDKKELSFGERKMLDTARHLLWKELVLAKEGQEFGREEKIASIFNLDLNEDEEIESKSHLVKEKISEKIL